MFRWNLLIDFIIDCFNGNYGWARWVISISKLLTCNCNHTLQFVHGNSRQHLQLSGTMAGLWEFFPVPVKCGVGGAKLTIPNIELTDLNFYVGNYVNNFWCKPNITSLRVGDMASTSGHGGLRSSSSFCSWSSGLTSPLGDLRPSFDKFKMAYHVEN